MVARKRSDLLGVLALLLAVLVACVIRQYTSSGLFYVTLELNDVPLPNIPLNSEAIGLLNDWEARRSEHGLRGLPPGVRFPSLSAPALLHRTISYEIVFLVSEGTRECRYKRCESKQGLAMTYLLEFAQSLLGSLEEGGILTNGVELNMRIKETNGTQCDPAVASSVPHLETWINLRSLELCQGSTLRVTMCDNEQKTVIRCEPDQESVESLPPGAVFAQILDGTTEAMASQFRAALGLPAKHDSPTETGAEAEGGEGTPAPFLFPPAASIRSVELAAWRSAASVLLTERLRSSLRALRGTLANTPASRYQGENTATTMSFWATQAVHARAVRLGGLLSPLRSGGADCAAETGSGTCQAVPDYHTLLEACALAQSLLHEPSLLSEPYFPPEQRASVFAPYWVPVLAPLIKAAVTLS